MIARRDFLRDASAFGALMAFAGCSAARWKLASGGSMYNFALPPMEEVRFGFIGLNRGAAGVEPFSAISGTRVTALCDLRQTLIDKCQTTIAKYGRPKAKEYTGGEDAWKAMGDDPDIDFVVIGTPMPLHAPMALYLMEHGKHVAVEVPSALTVEDCWAMVETSERTQRICTQIENCLYDRTEMMMYNAVLNGTIGEPIYAESGYIHDCRDLLAPGKFYSDGTFDRIGRKDEHRPATELDKDGLLWRGSYYSKHCGNHYPTHGLEPLSHIFNINRGDRFDTIVSNETASFTFREYAEKTFGRDSHIAKNVTMKSGDHHVSLIRTACGKLINLSLSVQTPRPYARLKLVQGTHGAFVRRPFLVSMDPDVNGKYSAKTGFRYALEKTPVHGSHAWSSDEASAAFEKANEHPLWRDAGELAKKFGGHGGMDFLMFLRIGYCLNRGLPLDQDVYDLAALSSIVELSEKSVLSGGRTMDFPDFTRGAWKDRKPVTVGTVDADYLKGVKVV